MGSLPGEGDGSKLSVRLASDTDNVTPRLRRRESLVVSALHDTACEVGGWRTADVSLESPGLPWCPASTRDGARGGQAVSPPTVAATTESRPSCGECHEWRPGSNPEGSSQRWCGVEDGRPRARGRDRLARYGSAKGRVAEGRRRASLAAAVGGTSDVGGGRPIGRNRVGEVRRRTISGGQRTGNWRALRFRMEVAAFSTTAGVRSRASPRTGSGSREPTAANLRRTCWSARTASAGWFAGSSVTRPGSAIAAWWPTVE